MVEMTDAVRVIAKQAEAVLANDLPTYYVPSIFMPVTSMPMTTSGKLDRKFLRTLAAAIPEAQLNSFRLAGKSGRAPSSHAETALARLWASVLNLGEDAVGVEDSFFRLGGDSISAMRLVTAARRVGVTINVANVFAQPKLLDMASTVIMLSSELTNAPEVDSHPFELLPLKDTAHIITYAASECGVTRDCIEDIFPCSKLQEGLIMLSSKDPGTYVVQPIYRLPANIDLARFKQAWNEVFAVEGILRTRIVYAEKYGFFQVVLRQQLGWYALADLRNLSDATRELPMANGAPLATFTIVGEGSTAPYFVWTAHHAVYDGWSWGTLFRKVEAFYRGTTHNLPDPVPYSRFVRYLTTLDQNQSDDFWLSHLNGMTAPQFPQLPTPDHRVEASGQMLHDIQMERNPIIEVTLPSMMRAAWGLLLATYSGCDDVLWGETNSGREASVTGIETLIGPTITTAPVRLQLSRQLTVHEYLKETQRQSAISLPYQFAGLQHIRKLSPETAAACDFQSFLSIEAGDDLADADSELWNMESANTIGTNFFSYALIFNCKVSSDNVQVEALYDDQVIEPWLVQRLVHQFEYILSRFNSVASLDQKLIDIDLINATDLTAINAWNGNPVTIIERCIHDVVSEDQTALRPNAVAIDAWDTGIMTYQELDRMSDKLARRLIVLGVQPQQFIPICFDKSGWIIVAILAILKAGAAFVPLDFEAPILRLREIVNDVDGNLILCGARFEPLCRSIPCSTLVIKREVCESIEPYSCTLPHVSSASRAYTIYTSGSTGMPKGAVINHYQWVTSSTAFSPIWEITPFSRVLQFSSYTFDACLIEILSTLMQGGTVCVPNQASRTNDLVGVINKFNVNWLALTPSVIRMIEPSQVPEIRTLVLVGEAMSQQDLTTWVDRVFLGNGYGPTECAVVATFNKMEPETKPNNLGKVITAQGWIVERNNHDALVPVGAIGELLLEGGGVGAGYLNNPEKTTQAFIRSTKWAKDVGLRRNELRMYKTGDLVKYNEDGTMLVSTTSNLVVDHSLTTHSILVGKTRKQKFADR